MDSATFELARRLVAESLSRLAGDWAVDGTVVRGPGTTAVRVDDLHGTGPAHLDLGFVLDRDRADAPVIWDCVSGFGATAEDAVATAVRIWTTCTAPVV